MTAKTTSEGHSPKDYRSDCRHFSGYKPCAHKRACGGCPHYEAAEHRILVVSLEALGAVLRSTCLLPALKRAYPSSHITFITSKGAIPLLRHNPFIDRLHPLGFDTMAVLSALEFDRAYGVDKSLAAGGLMAAARAPIKRGFGISPLGAIVPLSEHANYQYDVGLSDQLKFFDNTKPETQQLTESMELDWQRDPYVLEFTADESARIVARREGLLSGAVIADDSYGEGRERKGGSCTPKAKGLIGFSTGCSTLYPYKKFTVSRSIEVIEGWLEAFPEHSVVLFGGPEDSERNEQIYAPFKDHPRVLATPTRGGLRSGMMWMATADMLLSGCSLGLHIAIALKKPTVCWFGVSCHQEIDLYDRGVKILADVPCSPCWKRSCDKTVKCYDQVPVAKVIAASRTLLEGQTATRACCAPA